MEPASEDEVRARYEKTQEAMRKELEGPDEEDSLAALPKEPEVDPRLYRDVDPILFRGFLPLRAKIGETLFVFKSLNHHEFAYLGWLHEDRGEGFYLDFLAMSVFMVGGRNILKERDNAREALRGFFQEMPPPARTRVVQNLAEVNRKANNAIRLVEAFAMEPVSRLRWAQTKGLDLLSPSLTGVEGTQALGLNWGQLLWRSLNHFQDLREEMERQWEHAKFIGGCFAGKGIKRVHTADHQRRKEEIETRIARKETILREVVLMEKDPQVHKLRDGKRVRIAQTTEELAKQLEQDLKGEEDFHDRIVRAAEEYQEQVRLSRARDLEALVEEGRKKAQVPLTSKTDLAGLSPQELADRLSRRRAVEAQEASSMVVRPMPLTEEEEEFHAKWKNAREAPRVDIRPLPRRKE